MSCRNLRQEHRGPATVFSMADLSQEQWRAGFSPQEHLAWEAQTQLAPSLFPQQVVGVTILKVVLYEWFWVEERVFGGRF